MSQAKLNPCQRLGPVANLVEIGVKVGVVEGGSQAFFMDVNIHGKPKIARGVGIGVCGMGLMGKLLPKSKMRGILENSTREGVGKVDEIGRAK